MIRDTRTLRVLMLASGDLWAGAEAVVYELVRGLKNVPDVEVVAVLLNDGELASRCMRLNVSTYVLDEKNHSLLVLCLQLYGIIRRERVEIIHAHRYKENILAAMTTVMHGAPQLVSTMHGISETRRSLRKTIVSLGNEWVWRHCFARVVAVSGDLKRHLTMRRGLDASMVECIANGVPVPGGNRRKIDTSLITIGSAGRLSPVKDYPFLVEIAREVCSRNIEATFIIAGDGPDFTYVQSLIERHDLGRRVCLMGPVADMDAFYVQIDVYLNTSRHEGLPMTVLEAMGRAIPVVAPAVGGLNEIVVEADQGILVAERTSYAFASALLKLIEDPQLMSVLAEGGRKRVLEHFSVEQMVAGYCGLYQQVVSEGVGDDPSGGVALRSKSCRP